MNFKEAVQNVQLLSKKPNNDIMLELYSLYKQATVGDIPESHPYPGFWDMVGKAKWDAWEKLTGMSQEVAQSHYVDLVKKLTTF